MYVQRENGKIVGAYMQPQPDYAEEFLEDDDTELVAFLNPPAPIPQIISRRQFYQQLAKVAIITNAEALAAMRGVLPPAIQAVIDTLPAANQFDASMLLIGADVFDRYHPLVAAFADAVEWDDEQANDFWVAASQL